MSEIVKNKTLTNPLEEPFRFMFNNNEYEIPAKSTVSMVGFMSVHAARHLAQKILLNKGRYEDVIKNDKRVGSAVGLGEVQHVQKALLDRDEEVIDLDEILEVAKNKPTDKSLPVGKPVTVIEDKPVGKIEVVKKEEKEGEAPKVDLSNAVTRFAELKEIGWANLSKEQREEYKILKENMK